MYIMVKIDLFLSYLLLLLDTIFSPKHHTFINDLEISVALLCDFSKYILYISAQCDVIFVKHPV